MTPFTDDDLNQLKEDIKRGAGSIGYTQSEVRLMALLARLEAAEAVCEMADGTDDAIWVLLNSWRKSCRK